jgi:hypothetical protein
VNRRSRRIFALVQDRMRIADSLTRQLASLSLDRIAKAPDLSTYSTEQYHTRKEERRRHKGPIGASGCGG